VEKLVIPGLPNRDFWRGRRVLLTGHTGFKGAWLLFWLEAMGARVTGCSLAPDQPDALFSHLHAMDRLASETVDIRNLEDLTGLVRRARPEVVFHLAAQSLVRRGYSDPHGTFATNVAGTNNLMQALAELDTVRALVVTTTDKVYRNANDGRPFIETDTLGGHDPYSASKAACEMLVDGWRSRLSVKGCAVATARAGNVIGGGDWADDRLLPDAVKAWSAGQALQVRRPDATRPWQHAEADLGIRGLWDLDQTVTLTARWYRAFLDGRPARQLCEADCCAYLDGVKRASMACIQ
jgi:CDP-glucose 4,6-dehydratase